MDTEQITEANISKQIVRLSTSIAYRFQMGTYQERVVLSAALNLLTQALILSTSSPSDAIRMFTVANKTASLAHGKSK